MEHPSIDFDGDGVLDTYMQDTDGDGYMDTSSPLPAP